MDINVLSDRASASLFGVRMEALGAPFETWTAEKMWLLFGKTLSQQGIVRFNDLPTNCFQQHFFDDFHSLNIGDCTDDYDLTSASVESFIRSEEFDLRDQALRIVETIDRRCVGYGRGTLIGAEKLRRYLSESEEVFHKEYAERIPNVRSVGTCGNGVGMRIAPTAIYAAVSELSIPHLMRLCVLNAGLTHTDVRAAHAAFAIAFLIYKALTTENIKSLKRTELLEELIENVKSIEKTYKTESPDTISSRLLKIRVSGSKLNYPDAPWKLFGNKPYALESIPLSISILFEKNFDFAPSITEALLSGGDTDTNIALVGSVAGAFGGLSQIPGDWRNFRGDFSEPVILGRQLVAQFY